MIVTVISIIALVVSIVGVIALVWVAARGDPEREAEADARDYFDQHGRWPGE